MIHANDEAALVDIDLIPAAFNFSFSHTSHFLITCGGENSGSAVPSNISFFFLLLFLLLLLYMLFFSSLGCFAESPSSRGPLGAQLYRIKKDLDRTLFTS